MRSCEEALELISASLDGALTGDEQAALDEHLSRCPACSALLIELKSLRTAAAGLEEVSAPAGFAGQVMARIAADPVQEKPDNVTPFPRKKRSPWKGWAAAAAVVAVAALGAVTLPGRIGADNKSTAGVSADCAAPFLEESAAADSESIPEDSVKASEASDPEGDVAPYTASRANVNGAAPESENAPADTGGWIAEPREESPEQEESREAVDSTQFSDAALSAAGGGSAGPQVETYETTGGTQLPEADLPAVSCGTLTLTGEALPEGLEDYKATEDEQGTLTYVVPADYFFSCLTQLEEDNTVHFTYDASGDETAEYGLIIVEAQS